MKKIILATILLLLPLILYSQQVIEKIEIAGNERVTQETILYYLSSREGSYFDIELLKRDFRVLWATGFFSDIKIEESDGSTGKIVKITVEENPIIKEITYKTGKKLKENDIVDKLKENDEYILPYSYYSPHKIQKIQSRIEELLLEKGLQSGEVKVATNKKGKNEVEVVFDIKEGPKTKVGEVVFEGNPKLLPSVLIGGMKENKKHGLLSWITGKDTFKKNKLNEDMASLKRRYQEHGYMEATIGEPRMEEITKRSIFLKKQKMMKIIIPVDAGYRYMVGEVKIEGNKIINTKYLRDLVKLEEGKVYNIKAREKAIEKIGELYRDAGYLWAQVMPVESLDPKNKKVNVTFNIHEGEVAYLNRLEFKGNTYTKDKVIRREMLVTEGARFSFAWFKDSIRRMQQLGLVELEGEPDIRPSPENPTHLDVTMSVKELQRNNIQFSAGYSGYQGTFISLGYSTVNFLGAGEKLDITVQHGKRIKNYIFGFSEPYFLDYPITLGFNIYSRYIVYPWLYDRKGKGIDFIFGARIKGYWKTNVSFGYEDVEIDFPGEEGEEIDPIYSLMYGLRNYAISSISWSVYRSTVDHPLTPTSGTMYLASCQFAGTFLGGDIDMLKPRFEWTFYKPVVSNHVVGLHLQYSLIKPIRDSQIPYWERFYLGGERSIRGYDIYTIGPRSERGTNIGGEKSLVLNAEYIVPVGGPLYAILFHDAGNAYAKEQKINFKNLFTSTGLELRIFVPALRVPFRLIFSYNNRKIYASDTNYSFRFAIGTTF
ncbi:MAG: outer membrane protein assembly factor BamA [Candidatus Aminicenantes bacterium]|nr:MAG: outer membrane protein assembly factor BamA [Candidatus Aminicenantes bacterium]